MASEKVSSRGQAWFCTTGLPTDIVIEIGDMSFHLHKFPLMSKSRKLHQLITDREQNSRTTKAEDIKDPEMRKDIESDDEEEYEDEDFFLISLPDFPGGSEIFETAAKFCYNVKIEMTAWNAVPLRCAAEYLDMADDFADDNLIVRTDRFLAQSVLRNLKDSIVALKSCDLLLPMAEDLGLVQRCIDSIASRAAADLSSSSFFGWPIPDEKTKLSTTTAAGIRSKNGRQSSEIAGSSVQSSWLDDLNVLNLPIYKRVLHAMKSIELSSDLIEGSLISYAKKSIPGLSRSLRTPAITGGVSGVPPASEAEQTELLETVISNLPEETKKSGTSSGQVTVRFLFGLLRTVNILRGSENSKMILEKKISAQLEHAKLDDLLMPSYSYLVETLYDVECVERIFGYFAESIKQEITLNSAVGSCCDCNDEDEDEDGEGSNTRLLMVGKLVDGYLSEIASDANLKPEKFCDLALVLPEQARVYDDGLYRAVDVYLKAHPRLTEEEREKVCAVMDCQKLTLEACTHAAQNERLPLRAVVQVLFFEQLQLRQAIAGTMIAADLPEEESVDSVAMAMVVKETREGGGGGETWRSTVRENQIMRLDMDSMRNRVQGLERECSSMRKVIASMDRGVGVWALVAKRFGCKFATQVRNSQQRSMVASRKSRFEQSP